MMSTLKLLDERSFVLYKSTARLATEAPADQKSPLRHRVGRTEAGQRSHQQRTALEFTWNRTETTSRRWSRSGSLVRTKKNWSAFTPAQTNRTCRCCGLQSTLSEPNSLGVKAPLEIPNVILLLQVFCHLFILYHLVRTVHVNEHT